MSDGIESERDLLPRASLLDLLLDRGRLVGSRVDGERPRGLVSPIEARIHMGIPYGDLAALEKEYLDSDPDALRDAGVIARAVFAKMLAPAPQQAPEPRPRIVAARVDNLSVSRAVDAILGPPGATDRTRFVFFVHAHALNIAAFDREFASLLASADLVLPDGIGLRIAARMLGVAMRHNLNGTDLLGPLCDASAKRDLPLAFIGGQEGVAAAAAINLSARGASIPVTSHGYLDADGIREVVARIRALGPCVVLVGMGSPLQERWAVRHLSRLPGVTAVTVGGLFDFFSGRVTRAPVVWRELGLEWLYRLRNEPRRLGPRYLLGNPLFLSLALRQRVLGPRNVRQRK